MVVCLLVGCHGNRKLPLTYNGKMVKLYFYALPQKVASVLCYTIRNCECPSVQVNIQGLGPILDYYGHNDEVF